MAAIPFIITNAGLGLLAQVGTIGPVTISALQIGSAGYTANISQTALSAEIKSLTPTGSSVAGTGIISITCEDTSTDAYSVQEIGLITSTGILFAIYSQTSPFLTKTSGNIALFSIDLALTNVNPTSVTVGSVSFSYPPATESSAGVAQIATTAQVNSGTDNTTIVTPAKLSAQFASKSLTTNGYQVFPGGLIFQWGKVDFGSDQGESTQGPITLPISFPNAFLNLSLTGLTDSSGDDFPLVTTSHLPSSSLTNFYIFVNSDFGTTNNQIRGFFWMAVGN